MALSSMTGFARRAGSHDLASWIWELKSVNGKSLDIRCRLPSGMDAIEARARAEITKSFRRGNVSVGLQIEWRETTRPVRVNEDVLAMLCDAVDEKARNQGYAEYRVHFETLLGVRGVVEAADARDMSVTGELEAAICADLAAAVADLGENRFEEGARLHVVIQGLLEEIARLISEAEANAATRPDRVRERMRTQVTEIMAGIADVSEERLLQEIAVLLVKGDIREELDRLTAHVAGARDLIDEDAAIGRRFDFLCQEFNREANTLCSKSDDIALTRTGLALKATIDQLREQIQNIE